MATLYSATESWTSTSGTGYARAYIDYSISSSNTQTTISGTVYYQVKGKNAANFSTDYLGAFVQTFDRNKSIYYKECTSLSQVKKTSFNYANWTTKASKSFSFTLDRLTSDVITSLHVAPWLAKSASDVPKTGPSGSTITYQKSVDITIPALPSYAVTYNANGGTGAPANQTKYYGIDITIPSVKPTRTNYVFVEWNTASDGTGTSYSVGDTYSADAAVTLYAQWKAKPSITSLTVIRCDSNGVPDDDGLYAKVTCVWTLNSLMETGTVTGTLTSQGGTVTQLTFTGDTVGTGGTAIAIPSADPDQQYTAKVVITNGAITTEKSVILTRAFFIMDFLAGGGGIGIGRAAPASGLEVGYDATFDEDLTVLGDTSVQGLSVVGNISAVGNNTFATGNTEVENPFYSLDTSAPSGTDHDLYAAITALGWESDVIV